ncbi:hypothetical protein [Nonomuraea sp. SBT364]|uniref:hypothetical protein n=1 Tax=Nonomuraea sp. SBT364 TaxID=1580530 RepID=UPI0012E329F6|nr:hypothetical protein [Nonomuraea sp. SBT364]
MPVVEFLIDYEAPESGRYGEVPSSANLERVFFLDDEDRELVERRRGERMKLGFSSPVAGHGDLLGGQGGRRLSGDARSAGHHRAHAATCRRRRFIWMGWDEHGDGSPASKRGTGRRLGMGFRNPLGVGADK